MSTKNTSINKRYVSLLSIVAALAIGFWIGRALAYENITTNYECGRIAAFHADKLLKEGYQFSSNDGSPLNDINQNASNLNFAIRELCSIEPKNWDPRLRPIIDEMVEKQYSKESKSD